MEQTPSPAATQGVDPAPPSSSPNPFQDPQTSATVASMHARASNGEVSPNSEERTLALVAHGLTFVEGGFFGPLVIYLLKKRESDFVAFHALQSLAFTGLYLLVTMLSCGLLGLALVIPYVVFQIIACIRAYEGTWYELPLVGAWARRKHPGHTMASVSAPAPAPPPPPASGPNAPASMAPLPPAPLPPAPNPTGAPMPRFY